MPKPKPKLSPSMELQPSLPTGLLFAIDAFLDKPLTKRQFFAACAVGLGISYLYRNSYYPKLSSMSLFSWFTSKKEGNVVPPNTPNESNPDLSANSQVERKDSSSELITDAEHREAVKEEKSQRTFWQRTFG